MHKILIIANREYRAMVATKAFVITLVLMPVMMGGGIVVEQRLREHPNLDEKRMVVLDQTGVLFKPLAEAAESRNKEAIFDPATGADQTSLPVGAGPRRPRHRPRANRAFRAGPPRRDLCLRGNSRGCLRRGFFQGRRQGDILLPKHGLLRGKELVAARLNNAVRRHRLQEANIDPEAVDCASTWVMLEGLGLFGKSSDGQVKRAEAKSEKLAFMLPFGMMMLMFMVILLAAQPMIETVMEERSQRIAEVLLGSVSPSQLMAGKLLGCVGGSLTIVVVYGVGALALAQYYQVLNLVPLWIVPWFLIYQVLAVLLFSRCSWRSGPA